MGIKDGEDDDKDSHPTVKGKIVIKNPTEVVDLRVFSSVKSSEDYTNRINSFDVYSADMVFSMVAASETEKEDWIRAIGRAIVISRTKSWQDENDDVKEDYLFMTLRILAHIFK